MPTTTVTITNPRLVAAAFNFRSITERRDLPQKRECLPTESNGIFSNDPNWPCQDGCGNEQPFMYRVEPGDKLPLQFQAADLLSADPEHPTLGWRTASGDYFIELQAVAMDGTVLWEGDTNEVSDSFLVGYLDGQSFQNVVVDIDRLLALMPEGTSCWFFRVKVFTAYRAFNSANSNAEPVGPVPIGYRYIPVGQFLGVQEWNGTSWFGYPVNDDPEHPDNYWYAAEQHLWYHWNGSTWVESGVPPPPPVDDEAFDFLYTMGYRLRRCNEPVVRFRSVDSGTDCDGWIHQLGSANVGPTISNAWDYGSWDMAMNFPPYFVNGAVVLNEFDGNVYTRTAGAWVQSTPADGSLWTVSSFGNTSFDYFQYQATGSPYWITVNIDQVPAFNPFQHDFKVIGSAEVDGLPIEREVTRNGRLRHRTSERTVRVRTVGLPETVALRIQAVLAAKAFFIDEEPYTFSDGFRKNNEEGAHWHLDFSVGRTDCDTDTSCDD